MTDRLHVYLLLDTSASMHGAPLEAMRHGLQSLIGTLIARSKRPVQVAILGYESSPRQLMPLSDINDFGAFPLPKLEAMGSSGLGKAIRLALATLPEYRPALMYIFTDGEPTDDWKSALALAHERLDKIYGLLCGLIADPEATEIAAEVDEIHRLGDMTPDKAFDTFRAFSG
ncbi:MAG TPA: VWA domain-containing protein [Aggregatilineales bacterium]|nr:VWA domain-containing protein [Aggregatilineales bacterium]